MRWRRSNPHLDGTVQLLITNCTHCGNTADWGGGAIWGGFTATLEISNTQLNNNKASQRWRSDLHLQEGSAADNKFRTERKYCW